MSKSPISHYLAKGLTYYNGTWLTPAQYKAVRKVERSPNLYRR